MHDKGKVLIGLAVFLVVILFPIWFSVARGGFGDRPNPDPMTDEKVCVLPVEEMRTSHMELLDDWRDSVVRDGRRMVRVEGLERPVEMSLARGCLGCHGSKEKFCDACHDYADVRPYCWDCHIVPEGSQR